MLAPAGPLAPPEPFIHRAMHGFFNKVLIVNASTRETAVEEIQDKVYQNLLGGKGLATWLLLRHNPAGVDPFSPENRLIFAVGPMTDLRVHGSARYGVFTKSPLTGLYVESYSGGKVADRISRTGFDAVVFQGASDSPVWIDVSDRGASFHDAGDLWGKSVYETEDLVLERLGDKKAAACVIGPGGENLVGFANIINGKFHCAGRAGVGAVMGSKKIKAISFRGSVKREAADESLLGRHWKYMIEIGKDNPGVKAYKKYGTTQMVKVANSLNIFPTRYWTRGSRDDWEEKLSGDVLLERCKVSAKACPRCFMACTQNSEVLHGRHKGLKIEGPEYETIYAFGGLCMIEDLEEIIYLNDLCNSMGVDTITGGNLVGFAMRARELGAIDYPIEFGDVDASAELLGMISRREGIGDVLARGIVHAARTWELEDEAIHVKGLEPAGYDPRPLKGMGLAYAVSDRGACHLRTTFYKAEIAGISPPDELENKAAAFLDFEDRCTLFDTMILCRFHRDVILWDELATLVKASAGMDLDKEGLAKIASNVVSLSRAFNLREGMTRAEDSLPRAFYNRKMDPTGASITESDLARLVSDYYRLRGWNEDGEPGDLPF